MEGTQKCKMGHLFIVAAPTGGGKTTLVSNSLNTLQKNFPIERIVTYTTRKMRKNEENGRDYIFINREEFLKLQTTHYFFEVTIYNDNLYGSPRAFLDQMKQGKSFIVITDRAGITSYKKLYDQAICIWITPPSLEILATRLKNRCSETEEQLQRRLALAAKEIKAEKETPLCTYEIINSDINEATNELIEIISRSLDAKE